MTGRLNAHRPCSTATTRACRPVGRRIVEIMVIVFWLQALDAMAPVTAVCRAQTLQVPGLEVTDRALSPEDAESNPSAFADSKSLDEAPTESQTLPELLDRQVGVQIRSLGGVGSFTAVLIRGSSPNQVAVFLDGIPLNRGDAPAVDLSLLPFFLMDRVEIFRGMLPAELGSFAVGGAVNLVTRMAPKIAVTETYAGLGSWWTRRAGVYHGRRWGRWGLTAALTYSGSQGTFRYFDDNQTPYQTADDRYRTRSNNQFDQVSAMLRVQHKAAWKTTILEQFTWKRTELAGTASQPPMTGPFYGFVRQAAGLTLERTRFHSVPLGFMLRAHASYVREHFSNPDGLLLSVGRTDSIQDAGQTGLLGRLQFFWGDHQVISFITDLSADMYRETDDLSGTTRPLQSRLTTGLALRDEITLWADRIFIIPVVRIDMVWDRMNDAGQPTSRLDWLPSPRLGLALKLDNGFVLKANAGRYFRPPSFMEIFGYHGVIRGNDDLTSEQGWSFDAGPGFSRRFSSSIVDKLDLEVAGFGRRVSNLIYLLPTARSLVAQNWGEAWIAGMEASAAIWMFAQFRLSANYTFLYTEYLGPVENLQGNSLPGRSAHDLAARLDWVHHWGRWGLGLFGQIQYRSSFWRDLANQTASPARLFLALGLKVRPWVPGLTITLEARNILARIVDQVEAPSFTGLDRIPQAVSDYAGYPIPGRAFYVTADWKHP